MYQRVKRFRDEMGRCRGRRPPAEQHANNRSNEGRGGTIQFISNVLSVSFHVVCLGNLPLEGSKTGFDSKTDAS